MIVDIQGDIIQINLENDNLKGYHISQLVFYGFSSFGKIMQLKTDNPSQYILRVIDYFETEGIEFSTTNNLSKQLDIINERKEQLCDTFNLGKEIKELTILTMNS